MISRKGIRLIAIQLIIVTNKLIPCFIACVSFVQFNFGHFKFARSPSPENANIETNGIRIVRITSPVEQDTKLKNTTSPTNINGIDKIQLNNNLDIKMVFVDNGRLLSRCNFVPLLIKKPKLDNTYWQTLRQSKYKWI